MRTERSFEGPGHMVSLVGNFADSKVCSGCRLNMRQVPLQSSWQQQAGASRLKAPKAHPRGLPPSAGVQRPVLLRLSQSCSY